MVTLSDVIDDDEVKLDVGVSLKLDEASEDVVPLVDFHFDGVKLWLVVKVLWDVVSLRMMERAE